MRRGRVVVLLLALGAAGAAWRLRPQLNAQPAQVRVPTAAVRQELLAVTLPVSGSLESAVQVPVLPQVTGKLAQICQDSIKVKPGDFIAQIDTKDFIKSRDELVTKLKDAQEEMHKAQASGQVEISQAQSAVARAQEALELARQKAQAQREKIAAQVAFARGELARRDRELQRDKRLADLHYIPGTRLQATQKAYDQQQFQLERQLREQQDTEQAAAEQIASAEAELKLAEHDLTSTKAKLDAGLLDQQLKIRGVERSLAEANQKIADCTLAAPAAGMVFVEINHSDWMDHRPWRVGDEVDPGDRVASLYDSNRMQVRCEVGEMDVARVKGGQQALVWSPSQPGRRYQARVHAVEELATEVHWRRGTPGKKAFAALIKLAEGDPVHLRPGMTVDLEIVLQERKQALLVPLRAVFREGRQAVVYRQQGEGFIRVPVKLGVRNDLMAQITEGLRRGDRVALLQPPAVLLGVRRASR